MDEKTFTQALVSLKGNELKIVYVMFCRTSLFHMMSSKLANTFGTSSDHHFTKQLQKEMKMVKGKKDEELQLELLEEMSKVLNLHGIYFSTKSAIEKQVSTIINDTCEMLKKQEKTFHYLCSEHINKSPLSLIIEWQMKKVLHEFNKQFQKMNQENQKVWASQLNEYIYCLPNEQQQKIQQKLGIENFSDDLMHRKLAASGVDIVFTIIGEASEETVHHQLCSLFTHFLKAFDFIIPYSIGSTSIVMMSAFLDGGPLLYKKQNKSFQKRLLPMTILQIVLSYISGQSNHIPNLEPLINTWNMVFERYDRFQKQLIDQRRKIEETESVLVQTKETIQRLQYEHKEITALLQAEKNKILTKLKETSFDELRLLAVSTKFELVLDSYAKTVEKIENRKYKQISKRQHIDLFDKLKTAVEKWDLNVEINRLEKEADKHLQRLTAELCIYYCPFVGIEHKAVQHYEKTIQLLAKQLREQTEKAGMLSEEAASQKQEERYLKKRKENLEKEHYALNCLELNYSNSL